MASEWFYRIMGEQLGPVSSSELKRLARSGTIDPDTHLRNGNEGEWVLAGRVKGLFEHRRRIPAATQESTGKSAPKAHVEVARPGAPGELTCAEPVPSARGCPSCGNELPPSAVICIRCGLDLRSGTRLATKHNDLADGATSHLTPEAERCVRQAMVSGFVFAAVNVLLGIMALSASDNMIEGVDNQVTVLLVFLIAVMHLLGSVLARAGFHSGAWGLWGVGGVFNFPIGFVMITLANRMKTAIEGDG